jgi:hypothetical protein
LIAEGVKVFDGVNNEDRVDRSGSRLKVCEYVLTEEGDDVHEHVGRGDTELMVRTLEAFAPESTRTC